MMKVLFLDFDGVLNTEKYQSELRSAGKSGWDEFGQLFDPEAIENLTMILDVVPEVLLVINSSWKLEGLERMKALWRARNLPGSVYGVTPDYVPDLLNIDLSDPDNIVLLAGKGNEVKAWLEQNVQNDCRYVIFDDIPDFLPEQEQHLIVTNPIIGISHADAITAINILSGLS